MEEYIHQLFRKFVKGKCSKQEFGKLMSLLKENSHEAIFRQMLQEVYRQTKTSENEINIVKESLPVTHRLGHKVNVSNNGKRRMLHIAAAACLLFAISVIGWQWMRPTTPAQPYVDQAVALLQLQVPKSDIRQHTQRAEQKHIVLSDGTEVWLNAESSLQYPKVFDARKREVYLVGEGFFDVNHADKWPFVIHTAGGVSTHVLGTAFDVKAYTHQKVSVSVKRGLVQVSQNKKVLATLSVGQKIQVEATPDAVPMVQQVKKDNIAGWTEGKLCFEDLALQEILEDLERTYNVQIELLNSQVKNEKITSTFNHSDGIQKVLQTLCTLTNTQYTFKNKQYVIN